MFGPVEGKRHDSGMLADSVLLNQLQQHLFDTGERTFCIYGDPAYRLRVHLHSGFTEELRNLKMSSVRQAVEWIFGDIVNFFKFLDFKKNLKIELNPVGKMYIVSALLHNPRSCFMEQLPQSILNVNHQLSKNIFKLIGVLLFCYSTDVSNSSCCT